MVDTSLPPPTLSAAQISTGLAYPGSRLVAGQFTYSIPGAASTWPGYDPGEEPSVGYQPLSTAQAGYFDRAIAAWDALIAPNFTRTDDLTNPGSIRIAFSTDSDLDGSAGYTYESPGYRGNPPDPVESDIWLNGKYSGNSYAPGSYDFGTLLHEIGHALGLKHSFEAPLLPAAYDSVQYTLMSYTDVEHLYTLKISTDSKGPHVNYVPLEPITPMVLDIAAVQAIYGADKTTDAGNTAHHFNPNVPFLETLYDAGGTDTIDLTSIVRPSNVDLTPGAYSSIGYYSEAAQIADLDVKYPGYDFTNIFEDHDVYLYSDNLGIALNTVIENVISGPASDTITGNFAGNGLLGGDGADFIRGMDGTDYVDGQGGNDDVNGNVGDDVVHGGDGADSVRGGQGADSAMGDAGDDPHVNGNLGDDTVHGGDGNDTVYGGQGSDLVYGDDGDDQLSGDLGTDTLQGGAGADRFLLARGTGADLVQDFSSEAGDRVQVGASVAYTVTADPNSQAVISIGGGDQITLAGVTVAAMGDWLVVA